MRPLILVSNDDGVTSSGVAALARAMDELGEVWVVAPDRERSAVGHSISLGSPLRTAQVQERWIAVDGTPTDCVYLAISHLLPRRPSLLVSGINHGANLGNDVTYSGTVSGAMEGTVFNVPSVAFSQLGARGGADFAVASTFAIRVAKWVLEHGLPPDTLLNVNIPKDADIERYQWTTLGKRRYGQVVDARIDPRGRQYFWIGGDEIGHDDIPGSDCNGIAEGYITVSPVHLDLTNYEAFARLRETRF